MTIKTPPPIQTSQLTSGAASAFSAIERIKTSVGVLDVAREYGITPRGNVARCFSKDAHPNGDKNPSLMFMPRVNRFECMSCGVKGDVIDLYAHLSGLSNADAIRELSRRVGASPRLYIVSRSVPVAEKEKPREEEKPLSDALLCVYEDLCFTCIEDGEAFLSQESLSYLTGNRRGLRAETLDRFYIVDVKDYNALSTSMRSKHSDDALRAAGVLNEKGNLIFYHHRILIPFFNGERITFIQARRIDSEYPKYINLAGRKPPLFNTETLKGMSAGETVYLCEGAFDAMMLEQAGKHAVACLGVRNVSEKDLDMFLPFSVVLALDNDAAGQGRAEELAKMLYRRGKASEILSLPDGCKDVTDYFLSSSSHV